MKEPSNTKCQQVYRVAHELFCHDPDWLTFFRTILGVEGEVRKAFPEPEELKAFEQSNEHLEIQRMLAKLRDRSRYHPPEQEPTTVITVRLPKSVHDTLKLEAHARKISVNKLCIAKLLLQQREPDEEVLKSLDESAAQ